ncbi:MAG: hypothetical protein M1818_005129 [Claussenomyces sp. TS43310]|nr:MAG: hypothetical protein M1818_005129 [Claussenomyces sp. TS43310]
MSKVTLPVAKFTHAIRGISSSSHTARSSALLDSPARHAAYLPRRLADLKTECKRRRLPTSGTKAQLVDRLSANDLARPLSTLGGHRPTSPPPSSTTPTTNFRFMQGFQTSAPKPASHDASTIDFFFIPPVPDSVPTDPYAKLRVPLLPDNYRPDRSAVSGHAIEALDEAVPRPEIMIVATYPEAVLPAAMTEVVSNEGLEADMNELTKPFNPTKVEESQEPGFFKELWNSFLDDVFGSRTEHKAAA